MEIKKIKETCLYIRDLEQARFFYHGKLDFPIISYVENEHLFLRVGSSVLLCFHPDHSQQKVHPPPHYADGNQHLAFEVTPGEYDDWKSKLDKLEIPIIDEMTWGNGMKSCYFLDTEGNVLELVPTGVWEA